MWSKDGQTFCKTHYEDLKKENTGLLQNVILIVIWRASTFDGVSSIKYSTPALVPYQAQGRLAASHFQLEVY